MLDTQFKDFYLQIAEQTRLDLAKQKMLLPPEHIEELCLAYARPRRSLREALSKKQNSFIAVLQKSFPAEGVIIEDYDHLETARSLAALKGAAALAAVTEKHFYDGNPTMLTGVTHLVNLPIIRWDFIIDDYQLKQSLLWGADAVRLLVGLLDQFELEKLCRKAQELGLEIVAQVSNMAELQRVLSLDSISVLALSAESFELLSAMREVIPEGSPFMVTADRLSAEDLKKLNCRNLLFESSKCYPPARLQQHLSNIFAQI